MHQVPELESQRQPISQQALEANVISFGKTSKSVLRSRVASKIMEVCYMPPSADRVLQSVLPSMAELTI